MNRGSVTATSPSSASSNKLASSSSPSRAPVSAPLAGFHARARIGSRNSAACPTQKAARSSIPRRPLAKKPGQFGRNLLVKIRARNDRVNRAQRRFQIRRHGMM
jgi:hypothetical protein